MTSDGSGFEVDSNFGDDRGSLMRQWLIRFSLEQPFTPFVIRLEGGFEAKVVSPEAINFEKGVLVVTVFETAEIYQILAVDRIVALKVLG